MDQIPKTLQTVGAHKNSIDPGTWLVQKTWNKGKKVWGGGGGVFVWSKKLFRPATGLVQDLK